MILETIYYAKCINCRWFRLCDEELPYCPLEDVCNIEDCEDNRLRTHFEPKEK